MRAWLLAFLLAFLAACSNPPPLPSSSFTPHATTIYILGSTLGSNNLPGYLSTNLPAIKSTGFDTVYLPAVWADFMPASGSYNTTAFANARMALAAVRAAGMKAIIGLNYVGVGYAPDFGSIMPQEDACNWARIASVYSAFENYVRRVMTEYAAYSDMTSLMVFTEGAEGCGLATPEAAPQVAVQLQTTLGSLPSRMPNRAKWRIGYHDYSIVNLGWGNGVGPIALPNTFDFVSMVAYNVTTTQELDAREARFKTLYPNKPLIVGEMGANGCPGASPPQVDVDSMLASWALAKGHGFNLWGWPNAGPAECSNPVYGGYSITNPDGSPNQTAIALKGLLPHQ